MQSGKKATTSVSQCGDYCYSPCVPTSVQETKRPRTAQLPNPETVCGTLQTQRCSYRLARSALCGVISRSDERDQGSPCLLVPRVQMWWLYSTDWEGILRVRIFNIMVISSLKLSGWQKDVFRGFTSSSVCFKLPSSPITVSLPLTPFSFHTQILGCYVFMQ